MSSAILPPLPVIPNVEVRHIPGWPGYAVSDDGRVWTCRRTGPKLQYSGWKEKHATIRKGYKNVSLFDCGQRRNSRVSRLILESFVGPCPASHEACHENGDRSNDRLSNLRWGTHISNEADKRVHGTWAHGEHHNKAKLTAEQVLEIRHMIADGHSQRAVARLFNVSQVAIGKIARKEHWKHIP